LDRWPLSASTVSIMPELVERPLDKYLHKYDETFQRVIPDFMLQYKTAEQQFLYEGDFSLFVHEITDLGALVQDAVTGVAGFLPERFWGGFEPQVGELYEGARCVRMENTITNSYDIRTLRLQTGIVWEWDDEKGEGYILPSEDQGAWKMVRVFRRDIAWHDCYKLFVGQFVQFETVFPEEVPSVDPNDEKYAFFALNVRSPDVLFSLEGLPASGQMLTHSTREKELTIQPRQWMREKPIEPDAGRPALPQVPALRAPQKKGGLAAHPALARFADTSLAGRAESPAWMWQEKMESDMEEFDDPIIPFQTIKPMKYVETVRILSHEVATEQGDRWKEPAFFKREADMKKIRPPGRALQEKMSMRNARERQEERRLERRRLKLRAASVTRRDPFAVDD